MSSPVSWPRVKALFEDALEQPARERSSWLDDACEGDADLRVAVERLLAAENTAEDYFGAFARDLGTGDPDALPLPGRIGPWQVVREVGRGGMGQVLLAERADGLFDQRVAIKLVHPGLAPDLIARFRAERRILAGLEHPGIARLLDGGQAPDGRPYLAMEYVDGEPVTVYADRKRLSIDARLDLFEQICEAVAYAHRHLVVHRDIKPSNVLVAESEDASPTVKLLDFGIAKLVASDGEDGPPTRIERRMLTPHYAAPEQVRGEAVTTATDVYALGVLLYELLTGQRPYGPTQSAHSAERAILEASPTLPSTAVLNGEAVAELAESRATSPARLRRRLQGDLDRIALAALRKSPDARYATAEALSRDVARHRSGLPVEARAPTLGYRTAQFIRRHRLGMAVTVAVLLLSTVFSVITTRSVLAERDRTRAERDRAEQVSTFLSDLLSTAEDPSVDQTTILRLLEPAVARAENELAADPEAQARVLHTLGTLYVNAARFGKADSLLRTTLGLYRDLHGDRSAELAEAYYDLGYLHTLKAPADSARVFFRTSAEMLRSLGRDDTPAYARSRLQWARMLPLDHPEKRAWFEEAMDRLRGHYGARSPEVAEALHEYYVLGYGGGTNEEVEAAFQESLDIYEENGMGTHRYALHAMANLAHMLDGRGALEESIEMYRRSAELGQDILPPGSADRVSMVVNYGATLHERGQFREAHRVLRAEAESALRELAQDSQGIAQSHYWYGRNLIALGQPAKAVPALQRAEEIYMGYAPDRGFRVRAFRADALAAMGQRENAERLYLEALDGLAGTGFESAILRQLVAFYADDGRGAMAERYRVRLTALEE
ncbi:MAG: hypothetical protein Rubg2KO_01630 [Rubricoccaceae bacterium]